MFSRIEEEHVIKALRTRLDEEWGKAPDGLTAPPGTACS